MSDYKATSSKEKIIALDTGDRQAYRRQLEVYQCLFRQNGFTVSKIGCLVFANARTDRQEFDARKPIWSNVFMARLGRNCS